MAIAFDIWDGDLVNVARGRFAPVSAQYWSQTYAVLEQLGYRPSIMEQKLMDGTHVIFKEDGEL